VDRLDLSRDDRKHWRRLEATSGPFPDPSLLSPIHGAD
jgi:hypothetical protein